MRELSVAEQRYQAVLAVLADGLSVKVAAEKAGVSRQTLHAWLARYEAEGLDGPLDRSRRPRGCPHQMSAEAEALVLELRRAHRYWGPQRIRHELARRALLPGVGLPSRSAIYRCLVLAGLIEPAPAAGRAVQLRRRSARPPRTAPGTRTLCSSRLPVRRTANRGIPAETRIVLETYVDQPGEEPTRISLPLGEALRLSRRLTQLIDQVSAP